MFDVRKCEPNYYPESYFLHDLKTRHFLLERSINCGALPLHMACGKGAKFTTKLLLQRGGNPYVTDRYGYTAFDWANRLNVNRTGRPHITRMLRKFLAVDIRLCVLGPAAEHASQRALRASERFLNGQAAREVV